MLATDSKYATRELSSADLGVSSLQTLVTGHFVELARLAHESAASHGAAIIQATELISESLRNGGKVLACGNGGSAADAQHMVGEMIGRVSFDRHGYAAISLTSDSSVVTAIGNDYGYENLFARQIEGLGVQGDVLVVMSTSGRSPNVVKAVECARVRGINVVAMTGASADPALASADVWIGVGSGETTHIQEIHTALLHTICLAVERTI